MKLLWWVFAAFYVGHIFPLVYLLTLRLPRNWQLGAQTALSVMALYFSFEMSVTLLLFTYVHAFIRTLDWTDRYAIASVLFLIVDWLFPPASQPLAMIAFPFLFLFWQRSLYYRRDYKRMLAMLAVGLSIGLTIAVVLRTIKELLFGDLVAWVRPFLMWIAGWFDGFTLDPSDRVNRFMVPENPNLDAETLSNETFFETASNQTVVWIALFIFLLVIGVFLFIYLQKRKDVQEEAVVPRRAHVTHERTLRAVRTPKHVRLLDAGRRLEKAHPRFREETVHDWLTRIRFTDASLFATWLEAAEYGEKDAPGPIIESFEQHVKQLLKQ
ncbi:hypothetical protein [Exiguobacterium alkaliphilum]|uniref:DUF4129 domain-containing protein n=1 Tax=Exiguobacterium alkaliphilum TaxID=1428684 RepID=A0ABT2KVJ8_9BACL|nr:hypothetical protein [Exiguobacterium alkaliphilum]MCT4794973.1 hypothetical protein [Exiguobacterium alkaliphilum]